MFIVSRFEFISKVKSAQISERIPRGDRKAFAHCFQTLRKLYNILFKFDASQFKYNNI